MLICATSDICYFCEMFVLAKKLKSLHILLVFLILSVVSCNSIWKDNTGEEAVARVGENYLYKKDIAILLGKGRTREDSISFVTNYINNWASKQLLLSKAKINLSEEKLTEFNELVNDYRNDLYTRAYKEALVQQVNDTVVTKDQMRSYYEKEKNNFRLSRFGTKQCNRTLKYLKHTKVDFSNATLYVSVIKARCNAGLLFY